MTGREVTARARAVIAYGGVAHVCQDDGVDQHATPLSITQSLVWGVASTLGPDALHTLRRPLLLSAEATLRCRATVKVAAKRLKERVDESNVDAILTAADWVIRHPHPPSLEISDGISRSVSFADDADLASFLRSRLGVLPQVGARHAHDRPVQAVLVDDRGRLLLESRNTNATHKMRHAEINLLLAWWQRAGGPPPDGARIVVSLKPCRMCAATIWETCAGRVEVLYLDDDPGPHARTTVFETEPSARNALRRISESPTHI
jgi:tRNA(Arg) A34 adenosine deaminase TadA